MQRVCEICGYVTEENETPEICPVCGAPASKFSEWVEEDDSLQGSKVEDDDDDFERNLFGDLEE